MELKVKYFVVGAQLLIETVLVSKCCAVMLALLCV
jgi:hypothetical protein